MALEGGTAKRRPSIESVDLEDHQTVRLDGLRPRFSEDGAGSEHGVHELRTRRSLWHVALGWCGPLFLTLTLGAVLGGLIAQDGRPPVAQTGAKAQSAAASDCDDGLDADLVQTELCMEHDKMTNFASAAEGDHLSFVVVGDWGRDGWCCQRDVALEMGRAAQATNASFVISTGDNFYRDGLSSPEDRKVATSWKNVYLGQAGLEDLPWYACLGNHDWHQDPQHEIDLTDKESLWNLPSRFYAKRFEQAGVSVHAAFLDTTPLIPGLSEDEREDVQGLYDNSGVDAAGYMDLQLAFLRKEFATSNATWRIVVGHHPVFTSSEHFEEDHETLRAALAPVLEQELGVSAYFNGHDHGLELHAPREGSTQYFLSGAGSKVRPFMFTRDEGFRLHYSANGGFLSVSANTSAMLVQFIDYGGSLLQETRLLKKA